MSEKRYQKGRSQELDAELAAAQSFGKIKVGQTVLFWRKTLRWFYIPAAELERVYRRVEEVRGKTGCCSNDFSIHRLMLVTKSGEEISVLIGDSLYRHEPERLMELMQSRWDTISYGKKEG